jgi:hypothetical protein
VNYLDDELPGGDIFWDEFCDQAVDVLVTAASTRSIGIAVIDLGALYPIQNNQLRFAIEHDILKDLWQVWA